MYTLKIKANKYKCDKYVNYCRNIKPLEGICNMHVLWDDNFSPVLPLWLWQEIPITAKSYLSRFLLFFYPSKIFFFSFLDFLIRSIDSNKHCKCSAHKRWWNSTLVMRSRWWPITVHWMGKRWDHIKGWQSGYGDNILEQWHHHTEPSSCSCHFRWQTRKVYLCCIQPERKNSSTIVCYRR